MKSKTKCAIVSAAAVAALAGCGKNVTGTPSAAALATTGPRVEPIPGPFGTALNSVELERQFATTCQLPESQVQFEVDSAELTPASKQLLQQVASCIGGGTAGNQQLTIVGQTDPRGGDAYNYELGMNRAESVARYLEQLGVSRSSIQIASTGSQGASENPSNWSRARRVTILTR